MPLFAAERNGLIYRHGNQVLRIEPWGKKSLRVRATVRGDIRDDLPHALLPAGASPTPKITIQEKSASISHDGLRAELDGKGNLRWVRESDGCVLLAELDEQYPRPEGRLFSAAAGDLWRIDVRFKAHADEKLFGLGQHQNGQFDQKGCVIEMIQRNTEVVIPFLMSSRGYGLLWNNPGVGRVECLKDQTHWAADGCWQMDYWVTIGTPAQIAGQYADATGHAPMLPEFAAGFWQSKLRYRNQEELLEVAREYHRRGLPLAVIVCDFFHWNKQGDWKFDAKYWPDPAGMVRELHGLGVKLLVSVWPSLNPRSANFRPMRDQGMLIRNAQGTDMHMPFWDADVNGQATHICFYDATHPGARAFIWDQVKRNYYDHGIRLWWLDACEPEIRPMQPENLRFHAGPGLAVANLYPREHARGFYENMRAAGETEIITLCRSAWAGSQQYGASIWSGDIESSFEVFARQIRAGLNMAVSGIPWWNTDIGGFHDGDITTPTFRELIVRWFQFGTFSPIMRLHGIRKPAPPGKDADAPNELWSFGEEAYAILRKYLLLREALKPYIMEHMRRASVTGIPMMRPLFYDYPNDPRAWEVDNAYLFGPDLLVSPVTTPQARSWSVYLPAGANWKHAWTGQVYRGGTQVEVDAPLEQLPLFVREGATVPGL